MASTAATAVFARPAPLFAARRVARPRPVAIRARFDPHEDDVDELRLLEGAARGDEALEPGDPLRSASPGSATIVRDKSGRAEMVYDVELPAIDMGVVFREAPSHTVAVVEKVVPESAAAEARCIEPGDVLLRCTATVFATEESDEAGGGEASNERSSSRRVKPALVTVGGHEEDWIGTRYETVSFECLGKPFDAQMNAVRSTGIVDAGFAKRKVRLEFMRALDDEGDEAFGRLNPSGHPPRPVDYDLRGYPPAE